MKTNNIEGLTAFEINVLIQQGGKFIMFPFIISEMVKRIKDSNVYFIRPNESTLKYALKHFFFEFVSKLAYFSVHAYLHHEIIILSNERWERLY
ncbi:hypothetical protein [Flavobacterium sp.]|uniref:hypothetical protein n=1 Tax=Flavobacterium sp. TaxID=239 RepID=UPI0025BBFA3C|nr:hypothetical protein [Flavobacterium sp.]